MVKIVLLDVFHIRLYKQSNWTKYVPVLFQGLGPVRYMTISVHIPLRYRFFDKFEIWTTSVH